MWRAIWQRWELWIVAVVAAATALGLFWALAECLESCTVPE